MNIRVTNTSIPISSVVSSGNHVAAPSKCVDISFIPNDNYVKMLRNNGFEVHVFQRGEKQGERRIVAIKFPYTEGGDEVIYDTYDSKLEDNGLFPLVTLKQRDVEALQNDPTFTYEGP
ncbi:MAG: hypothetical protein LBC30_01850 [Puniceicoccales bacterium]|jgi:N-acyl-L-homoserine lactone synthetase|nr:hypothetical protein [Puniceicoccales bacterium]